MGYFGGLGAGKGWHKLHFLLTPEELEGVLRSQPLVIFEGTADEGRYWTELGEYLADYRAFVTHLASGEAIPVTVRRAVHRSLSRPGLSYTLVAYDISAPRGLLLNRKDGTWIPLPDVPVAGRPFASLEPEEPVISVRPFELHYLDKLFVGMGDPKDPAHFGLELDYPRVVFFKREDYAVKRDAAAYPNAALFASLAERIRLLTRPCRIRSPKQVHRTHIRISPRMRELILGNAFLAERGLSVV